MKQIFLILISLISYQSFGNTEVPFRDISQKKEYIEYKKNNGKIYLSITSSPSRVDKVTTVLDSLDLSIVDKIFINLPFLYSRDKLEYRIPEELKKYPKVYINRLEKDLGPITKVIPTIEYSQQEINSEEINEAIVISVDDDYEYSKSLTHELSLYLLNNDKVVASAAGQNLGYWNFPSNLLRFWPKESIYVSDCKNHHGGYCQTVEGFGGVAYKSSEINVKLLREFSEKSKDCYLSDDLIISYVLAKTNIKRYRVKNEFLAGKKSRKEQPWGKIDALHRTSGFDDEIRKYETSVDARKYRRCMNNIRDTNIFSLELYGNFDKTALDRPNKGKLIVNNYFYKDSYDVTLSSIGHSSKKKCVLPKMKIDASENIIPGIDASSIFLITHCGDIDGYDFVKEPIRIWIAYKLLGAFDLISPTVSLAKVKYYDYNKPKMDKNQNTYYALLLEPFMDTASRHGLSWHSHIENIPDKNDARAIVNKMLKHSVLQSHLFSMLIGNTDWRLDDRHYGNIKDDSIKFFHNMAIFSKTRDGIFSPVPFDFDASSFVLGKSSEKWIDIPDNYLVDRPKEERILKYRLIKLRSIFDDMYIKKNFLNFPHVKNRINILEKILLKEDPSSYKLLREHGQRFIQLFEQEFFH